MTVMKARGGVRKKDSDVMMSKPKPSISANSEKLSCYFSFCLCVLCVFVIDWFHVLANNEERKDVTEYIH